MDFLLHTPLNFIRKRIKLLKIKLTQFKEYSHRWEQKSGPDLHVFTLKFLALKKCFFHVFGVKKNSKKASMFSAIQGCTGTWLENPKHPYLPILIGIPHENDALIQDDIAVQWGSTVPSGSSLHFGYLHSMHCHLILNWNTFSTMSQ